MKRTTLSCIVAAICAVVVIALASAPWAEAQRPGRAPRAEKPKAKPKPPAAANKRVGQGQIIPLVDGKPEEAIRRCEEFLQRDPKHLESLYNLTLALAAAGEVDKALATMHRAVEAGLPPGRFLAGPRRMLEPLAETREYREFFEKHKGELVHGPMLGCVTERSAKFRVRTAEEAPIQVVAGTSPDSVGELKSATVFSEAKRDFTAVAELSGLAPNTVYYYDVLLGGKPTLGPELPHFRTFPPEGQSAAFSVGFGGGAGFTPVHERMWDVVLKHRLAAFLFLGDNVYIDNPTRPDVQHYTYYRRQSRPEYRRFVAATPIYAIWDDHDFGTNDCVPGPKIDEPPWKVPVWRVFRNNWNNPGYGGGEDQPGCWFRFSIGDVDFVMLDGRFYRANPNKPEATMLGPVQKKWLKGELKRCRGTFKVLASPVPWVLGAKGNSPDTWRGFQDEREEIFSFLEENKIGGVILISADRHRSDVWRIDRERGYPLYEFESSRLTNLHTHGPQPGCLFSYNQKCSFGQLTFDTTKPDPEVTYRIYNIDDELIHAHVVKLSEISHR